MDVVGHDDKTANMPPMTLRRGTKFILNDGKYFRVRQQRAAIDGTSGNVENWLIDPNRFKTA